MNAEADVNFAIKSYLKLIPFFALCFATTFIIIFFGFAASLFEYYNSALMDAYGSGPNNTNTNFVQVMQMFSNIYNSYWLILVTMTTSKYT
jgi:hypothetical protein